MPHKRKPKKAKRLERLYSIKPFEEEKEEISSFDKEVLETGNEIPVLSNEEVRQIKEVISDRYKSAETTTDKISSKMDLWEKQYLGQFRNSRDTEDIFLRKTKEQVRTVYSHIMEFINDLDPLVSFEPIVSSLYSADIEFERAKVSEALVGYILNDLLKFKDNVLPQFFKKFP